MIPSAVYESTLRSFMAPIGQWLDDDTVTEIVVNGPGEIYVERKGRLVRVDSTFASRDSLMSTLRLVAQFAGRPLDEMHPILEAHLPDGARVEALLPPIAPDGPLLSIRRFSRDRLTIDKLLQFGALTPDAVETLRVLVECKQNIIVAGGTGSGKTSMLNAMSVFIPEDERVLVIEDSRELQLQRDHVVQLETRPSDSRGKGAISMRDLFKASLRMRPDRIILGEIRGGEALDLIQAMTSGHGGCLATTHATYPKDTLNRLETLALMSGVELPLYALRNQVASAIDFIVQTARFRDGRRRVTHITEVCGVDAQSGYRLKDIFSNRAQRHSNGQHPELELLPSGAIPNCIELIHSSGFELPSSIYATAKQSN
jgi:pilus assembly protein CpaF